MQEEEQRVGKKAMQNTEKQMMELGKQTKDALQSKMELQSKWEKQQEEHRNINHQREQEGAAFETETSALKHEVAALKTQASALELEVAVAQGSTGDASGEVRQHHREEAPPTSHRRKSPKHDRAEAPMCRGGIKLPKRDREDDAAEMKLMIQARGEP